MDPKHLFMDRRLAGMCVYCGAKPDTRDHVPSKVLLDEPYPSLLPVVEACSNCNVGFSLDEQYLSCFLECVICGTIDPRGLQRPKVKRILKDNPALQHRIDASRNSNESDSLIWQPETDRVRKIIAKLARGHAAYELYPKLEDPLAVTVSPLPLLSEQEIEAFENVTSGELEPWPEIGSRAFLRAWGKGPDRFEQLSGWIVIQPERYRYAVIENGGVLVRMVLSEYLACEVCWE